ncbi:MAG: winged helix-turn-helix domain-containing protein [Bryobacteraceae bacterium]|jgi:Tol biopolymer transport system component/DNA-binding winged helix-turn-helix (wHTH) protein
MPPQTLRGYRFGPFEVDCRRRLLLKNGQPVSLTPKSFDVLSFLVARHGDLIGKEEIMAAIWPGVAVEETNLTYHISVVRRALGESPGQREYIVTIPGHGYRFIAAVDSERPDAAAALPSDPLPVPVGLARKHSLLGRTARWLAPAGAALAVAALTVGIKIHFTSHADTWRQLTFDRAHDSEPDISPDGRSVIFVSNRQGPYSIWVMAADGSNPRNLSGGSGQDASPAWSPDGRRIAFQRTRGTVPNYILIMNADGSGQHAVSPKPGSRPAWSPDGRSLLYNSRRNEVSGILKLDLDSGTETAVTGPDANCYDAAWSPDGQWIAHTRETPQGLQLFVMDAQGGRLRQLTRLYSRRARVPAWSPDGNRLAFISEGDYESGIFIVRSDGTEVTRLTRGFDDAKEPAWSHDGSRIYFQSERSGNSDIFSIDVPRGTGERLTQDVGVDSTPVLSPSGKEVAFASNRSGSFNIFVQDLSTGQVENLTHNPADDHDPSWSPDGSAIVFGSNRTGRPQIFVLRRKDGTIRQISLGDESWTQPAWSPDGKTVAAAVGPEGHARIKLLPMAGGAPVDLAPDYSDVEWPAWSPDGKTIAFGSPRNSNQRIYAVPAAGGPVRPVTDGTHQSRHAVWRPDGALAFDCTCGFGTQIMLLEPGGGLKPLTNTLPHNMFPSFSKDGSRIVFASDRDGNFELYQIYN